MNCCRTVSLAALTLSCALAVTAETPVGSQHNAAFANAAVMNALHGNAWAVLVFAPEGKSTAFRTQVAELDGHSTMMADNNLVVVVVPPPSSAAEPSAENAADVAQPIAVTDSSSAIEVPVLYPARTEAVSYTTAAESIPVEAAEDQARARQEFNVADDHFTMVLVDQNGVERARWKEPVCALELETKVDTLKPAPVVAAAPQRHWYQLSMLTRRDR